MERALQGFIHNTFTGRLIRFVELGGFDEMAKPEKRGAVKNTKLGISLSWRMQKTALKDLDGKRKTPQLSRPSPFVKLAPRRLPGLKEPAEKMWEGAVERMFPATNGDKSDDPR